MQVKNNSASITNLGGLVVLRPGNNPNVDPKLFQKATEIAAVAAMLKAKTIEVVEGTEEAQEDSLTDMTAHEAVALVKETTDVDTLQRWKSEDSRKTVQEAIDAQVKRIEEDEEEPEE